MSQDLISGSLVPASRKLTGIHGLRAVAALMVVVPHMTYSLNNEEAVSDWIWTVTSISAFGVHLFFVLSAFSLFNSTRTTEEGLVEYAIKRFWRIAPLFYAFVVFQQIIKEPLSLSENILNFTFLFGIVQGAFRSGVDGGWSVGVEMTFYAVLPLILIVCRTQRDYAILAAIGTVMSWAAYRYVYDADPVAAESLFDAVPFFTFPGNIVTFCYGLLAYAVFRDASNTDRTAWLAAGLAALGVLLLVLTPLGTQVRTPDRAGAMVLFAIFALVTLWQALRPSWLLSNPVMQFIGERSFSTYLVQFPIVIAMQPAYHWIATTTALPSSVTLLLCYGVTAIPIIAAATLTHRFIEVPGVNIGRRIIQARRARLAQTV